MRGQPVKGRFLVIARTLPIESGGTMIVIRRLLDNFSGDEPVVLGRTPLKTRVLKNDKPLDYPCYEIPTPQIKGYKFWRLFSVIPGFFQAFYLIWRYKIKVIIGVYPDEGSLLLAYMVSFVTRKPLMAYFCDLYMENNRGPLHKRLSQWLQPKVFRRSSSIIAANQGMKDFYDTTYGIDTLLLPTAINQKVPSAFELPAISKPFIIGYSGSVVLDRLDPMQALIKAIGGNENYEIRLFTPQSEEYLKSVNIWAPNVKLKFCASQRDLIAELSACHVLYLPLTFIVGGKSNSREQLATCFGIKSYEYFLSCRPVLVHCPKDYFTATFFTRQECGVAIDSLDPLQIQNELESLQGNYQTVSIHVVRNALVVSKAFEGHRLAMRLTDSLNSLIS
jgi:hypothetical protein